MVTLCIDVCPSDGNLLSSAGDDWNIKIFDRRQSAVVKTFDDFHESIKTLFPVLFFRFLSFSLFDFRLVYHYNNIIFFYTLKQNYR